jgi:hypothetical protein
MGSQIPNIPLTQKRGENKKVKDLSATFAQNLSAAAIAEKVIHEMFYEGHFTDIFIQEHFCVYGKRWEEM